MLFQVEAFHSNCCTGTVQPPTVLQLPFLLSPAGRRGFGHQRALYGQEINSQTPGPSRAGSGLVPMQTLELPSIFPSKKSVHGCVFTSVSPQNFRDTGVGELHYCCSISHCIDQLLVKITDCSLALHSAVFEFLK